MRCPRLLPLSFACLLISLISIPLLSQSGVHSVAFAPVVTYSTGGYYAYPIAAADVNGDGKTDVVVGKKIDENSHDGVVGVLLGNGNGTLQAAVNYGTGGYDPAGVTVGHVNSDGKPDIVVAQDNPYLPVSAQVGVLLGNGDGTFQTAVNYSVGPYYADSVVVVDMNGDGKADIVDGQNNADLPGFNGLVGILMGNGDGTFQPVVTYSSGITSTRWRLQT